MRVAKGWIDRLIAHTVVAHLTSGESIQGVLTATHRDCLVMSHAIYLGTEAHIKVDGDAVIPRPNVKFIQVLPPDVGVDV